MLLSDFQTDAGFFAIAPFDHRSSLAQALHLDLTHPEDEHRFLALKFLFMEILSPHVSAVLTDPEYGIQTLQKKAKACGLFLSLEESGYSGNHDAMTTLKANWGVEGIMHHNAGVKLLVYYNKESNTAKQKLELVKYVYDQCAHLGAVLMVEPVLYPLDHNTSWVKEWDEAWIATHLSMCQEFAPYCDILKIQYPGNEEACKQVSGWHKNWILLSRGVKFELFKQNLEIALRAGCKGYAAGRAIWQELSDYTLESEWREFLSTVSVSRLQALTSLLSKS